MAPVTSARGLAETDTWEGGEVAENQTELLKHEWHHSRGASARRADCMHNPGITESDHETRPLPIRNHDGYLTADELAPFEMAVCAALRCVRGD